MKTRKILALLLVAAMMLSFGSIAAMADTIEGTGENGTGFLPGPGFGPTLNPVAQVGTQSYLKLAAAIEAANELEGATVTLLRDYDMEANEPGYGWTTAYVANGETTPRNNMIAISGDGLTFDLNGHTLSNLFNNTFNVTGANVTVTNGTMQIGELYYGSYSSGKVTLYDAPKTCSYVMFVEGAENFTVNDLTTRGGVNVAGESTATFNNYSFSGTTYYAIMAQENSVVTVNGGTYNKSVPGAANYLIWVEDGSTMNIVDGTFIKGSAKFYTGIKPVITGGTFDFDPTNSGVAADYTAVDNGNGTWTVVSNYAAEVNGTKYETLEAAIAAAEAGNTIKLLKNVTVNTGSSASSRLAISKSMTIDGNGFTVSINNRGFGVGMNASAPVDVTFRNVTITNASAGGRCVDTRGNLNSLTLDNVTLKTTGTSGYLQPLTIGGNQATTATVTITESTIQTSEDGSKGYAITTFNPVEMTITGSTLKGWACLNIKGVDGSAGSAGSEFTLTDSTIVSKNVNAGETNAYSAIKIEDDDVTVNIADSEIILGGPQNWQGIMSLDANNTLTDVNVNLTGEITATMTEAAVFAMNTTETAKLTIYGGTYNADPSDYVAEGYEAVDNGDGTWTVSSIKVAQVGDTQYNTLAAAIAAANELENATVKLLRDYDMEANEPGYGWTTLSHSARENFLVVSGTGLTFDLNGHTLSNLFNNTFKITGTNVTVKNGTMTVGTYTNGAPCSYVMITDGAKNFVVDTINATGGINIAGGTTATLNDYSFSGTSYYAVCSQEESTVTINGGTYDKATPGAANYLIWVENGSAINIVDGTFIKGSAKFYTGIKPVITGGTFDFDPTNSGVAEGYEAVALEGEDAGKFKVGKVQANDITLADEKTEGYDATYTATKQVVDESGEVLAESAAVKVNVKAVKDEVATDVTIDKVDLAAVLDTVMDAVDNTTEINVVVAMKTADPVVEENAITYEIHPVAKVFVDNEQVAEKAISNDDIVDDAFFTITLSVPNGFVNSDGKVKVRHISEGHQDEVALYAVAGTVDHYTVTFTIDHFSEFELTLDETGSTGNITMTGFNLALEDEIVINFKTMGLVDGNGDPADPAKFKVVYTFNGETSEKYLTNATEIETTVVARCAAKQLVDEVVVKVYYDGVIIYNRTYSVKTYCMNKINSTNQEDSDYLKELCRAILAYGAEAQNRFNYKTNNLANADIEYTVDGTVPSDFNNSDMPDGKDAVAKDGLIGKALELEYKTNIIVYFPYYEGDEYTVVANDESVDIEYTTLNETMPVVRAEITGIAARDLDQLVTITITDTTADTDYTFKYSPLNWAYKASANNTSEAGLANALYNYYLSAADYFAHNN